MAGLAKCLISMIAGAIDWQLSGKSTWINLAGWKETDKNPQKARFAGSTKRDSSEQLARKGHSNTFHPLPQQLLLQISFLKSQHGNYWTPIHSKKNQRTNWKKVNQWFIKSEIFDLLSNIKSTSVVLYFWALFWKKKSKKIYWKFFLKYSKKPINLDGLQTVPSKVTVKYIHNI